MQVADGMRRLVIIGTGGHAREQLDLIADLNRVQPQFSVEGFIVDPEHGTPGEKVRGLPILGSLDWLADQAEKCDAVCAIGSPAVRMRMVEQADAFGVRFPTLVHPSAVVGEEVHLAEGVVLSAGVIVTSDVSLAKHVHVNVRSTISHDCEIGAYATLAPGVNMAGVVQVEEGAEIGVGATISDRLRIGAWSMVGAGAVVVRDVSPNAVVVGVPARPIRERTAGWQRGSETAGD